MKGIALETTTRAKMRAVAPPTFRLLLHLNPYCGAKSECQKEDAVLFHQDGEAEHQARANEGNGSLRLECVK